MVFSSSGRLPETKGRSRWKIIIKVQGTQPEKYHLRSRNKLVVFTGLSGSGKSSYDTIYAEGQRRYMNRSLLMPVSSSARWTNRMLIIEGLSPAV